MNTSSITFFVFRIQKYSFLEESLRPSTLLLGRTSSTRRLLHRIRLNVVFDALHTKALVDLRLAGIRGQRRKSTISLLVVQSSVCVGKDRIHFRLDADASVYSCSSIPAIPISLLECHTLPTSRCLADTNAQFDADLSHMFKTVLVVSSEESVFKTLDAGHQRFSRLFCLLGTVHPHGYLSSRSSSPSARLFSL